jgi:hypothetical protein
MGLVARRVWPRASNLRYRGKRGGDCLLARDPLTSERRGDHETLKLGPSADPQTVKRIYRLLARRYHPDNELTGDAGRFIEVREAYRVLSNPKPGRTMTRATIRPGAFGGRSSIRPQAEEHSVSENDDSQEISLSWQLNDQGGGALWTTVVTRMTRKRIFDSLDELPIAFATAIRADGRAEGETLFALEADEVSAAISGWYLGSGGNEATETAGNLVATVNDSLVGSHNYAVTLIQERLDDAASRLGGVSERTESTEAKALLITWVNAYADALGVVRSLLDQLMNEAEPVTMARGRWSDAHAWMLESLRQTVATEAFDDVRADILDPVEALTLPSDRAPR